MKINKITFTGADDNTEVTDLIEISKDYPMVEWGLLYSEKRFGTERYPSEKKFRDLLNHNYQKSLHLCGKAARDFIQKGNVNAVVYSYGQICDRIQLNFNDRKTPVDLDNFKKSLKAFNIPIILQVNSANNEFISRILKIQTFGKIYDEFHYLFDASGGNGKEINEIPQPLFNVYCGYAGGLNPDNLKEKLELLDKSLPKDAIIYIDMESGVRTDGEFDIEKVKQCLEITKKYI